MEKLTTILVVIDSCGTPRHVIHKAMTLARAFGAKVELFLCDAERAYALRHTYDTSTTEAAREACLADGHRYLESLREFLPADVPITFDVACESPLYEGIVRKVLESRPDLVIKTPAGEHPLRCFTLDTNDWQLARTCPVPLMLMRGRPWAEMPRFAAAVDVSEQETAGLAREILHTGEYLSLGCGGGLEVMYSDREASDAAGYEMRLSALQRLSAESHVQHERIHALAGEPEETLPAFAAGKHYDVLVLGALTHRWGITSLIGTLTSKLVDALDCDFVLVKPASYHCPFEEPAAQVNEQCSHAAGS